MIVHRKKSQALRKMNFLLLMNCAHFRQKGIFKKSGGYCSYFIRTSILNTGKLKKQIKTSVPKIASRRKEATF
jgi:hypothetical protein